MQNTVNTALNQRANSTGYTLNSQQTSNFSSSVSDTAAQFQEDAARQSVAESVQQRAQENPAAFREALEQAYAGKASPTQLDSLTSMASSGSLPMPQNVRFVDAGTLGPKAMGAYDSDNGGTIYLDSRLLNSKNDLAAIYAEELGHHLDAKLGGRDAAGDEGAIFAKSLLQGKVSCSELHVLKSEDDSGFINIDGKRRAVEFYSYSGAGSSLGTGGMADTIAPEETEENHFAHQRPDSAVAANIGRAAAAGRESLIITQANRAYDIGANTPLTDYSDTVYRAVGTRQQTYANFTYSDAGGRYAEPGQTVLYNSETVGGVRAEAAHYDGMANQSVVRSDFAGSIVDVVGSNQITAGALSEPYGGRDPVTDIAGRDRTLASRITGEDPYTHPRAFANGARSQGAEAIRVPANDGSVNVNLLPENVRSMAGQYNYVDHTLYNASGNAARTVFSPSVELPPAGSTPGHNLSNSATFPNTVSADASKHSRAGGARYGAAGAGVYSTINALSDGNITLQETGDIARDTTLGTVTAVGSDVLGDRIGMVRGGAVVDGVVAVGTSLWSNADAVENGEMSAGDATADVVVDTGVAVTAGLTGMAVGAAVGSVIPIAGTAVGAGVGFIVGAGGAWLATKTLEDFTGVGDWAREGLGNELENRLEAPLNTVWDSVADAKDATGEFFSGVGDTLSDAGGAVKGFVGGLFGR